VVGGSNPTPAEVIIDNMPVAPGQEFSGTQYYYALLGGAMADLGVCNLTARSCLSFSRPSSAPGNSTEWIAEAPTSSNGVEPLASFGTVNFSKGCTSPYWPPIICSSNLAGVLTAIDLYQNGILVASPGPNTLNPLTFTDTYH
jgi:hypothetical protein